MFPVRIDIICKWKSAVPPQSIVRARQYSVGVAAVGVGWAAVRGPANITAIHQSRCGNINSLLEHYWKSPPRFAYYKSCATVARKWGGKKRALILHTRYRAVWLAYAGRINPGAAASFSATRVQVETTDQLLSSSLSSYFYKSFWMCLYTVWNSPRNLYCVSKGTLISIRNNKINN